jgi:hypothetical protein
MDSLARGPTHICSILDTFCQGLNRYDTFQLRDRIEDFLRGEFCFNVRTCSKALIQGEFPAWGAKTQRCSESDRFRLLLRAKIGAPLRVGWLAWLEMDLAVN